MLLIETTLFGVRLFASDLASACADLVRRAATRQPGIVCVANVDMMTRARADATLLAAMQQACLVVSDGMPLVWALRARGFGAAQRVYGPGLMRALCVAAPAAGVSVYLYGGTTQDELDLLVAQLRHISPTLRIAGAVCPPMLPAQPPFNAELARAINSSGAGMVFVGLGCPKQEYWMLTHAKQVNALMVGVGLAFAQIAGTKATAPRWMQHIGLEWAFRLKQEPRRLWRRYLVGNSLFVWYCAQAGFRRLLSGMRRQA